MEPITITTGGTLRIDCINILLRNNVARNVQVTCDVTIGHTPTKYGVATLNFEPDEELIAFIRKKVEEAIVAGKVDSNMPYLKKITDGSTK